MGQEKLHGLYCLVNGGGWWTERVGQMGQEKLHGLYWLDNCGGLKDSGTDGTNETLEMLKIHTKFQLET
jgi:hypothetical protein